MIEVNDKNFFYKIKRFFNNLFNKNNNINNDMKFDNKTETIIQNEQNNLPDYSQINENEINNNILATPDTIKNRTQNIENVDNSEIKIESRIGPEIEYIQENEIKIENEVANESTEKQQFLKQLDGNTEMLKMLSLDRLKKLDSYYMDIINKNNDTINSLI